MKVNEIFYSLQGEGARAGTANVFVRFAGCDLACAFCDTEFESAREMSEEDIITEAVALTPTNGAGVIFTGGEPALQLTRSLVELFDEAGYYTAIETNGLHALDGLGLDWVTVSPKTAEHTLKVAFASEVKYVRHVGQGIPEPRIEAAHQFISPEWGERTRENLDWCIRLVKENPQWRLSIQQHKLWHVR